eukprot:403334045
MKRQQKAGTSTTRSLRKKQKEIQQMFHVNSKDSNEAIKMASSKQKIYNYQKSLNTSQKYQGQSDDENDLVREVDQNFRVDFVDEQENKENTNDLNLHNITDSSHQSILVQNVIENQRNSGNHEYSNLDISKESSGFDKIQFNLQQTDRVTLKTADTSASNSVVNLKLGGRNEGQSQQFQIQNNMRNIKLSIKTDQQPKNENVENNKAIYKRDIKKFDEQSSVIEQRMSQRNLTTGTFKEDEENSSLDQQIQLRRPLQTLDSNQFIGIQKDLHPNNINSCNTQQTQSPDSSQSSGASESSNSSDDQDGLREMGHTTPLQTDSNKKDFNDDNTISNSTSQSNTKAFDYYQYLNKDQSQQREQQINSVSTPNTNIKRYLQSKEQQTISTVPSSTSHQFEYLIQKQTQLQQQQQQQPNIQSSIDNSFQLYLDKNYLSKSPNSAHSQNQSSAIAGAMRALQSKIKQLEQENSMLKDCFQGIQKRCVDMEATHKQETEQTLKLLKERIAPVESQETLNTQQSERDSQQKHKIEQMKALEVQQGLLQEIEGLQDQLNLLKEEHQNQDKLKNKYKKKVMQYKQEVKVTRNEMINQESGFKQLKDQYLMERQKEVSQKMDLERQNQHLIQQLQQKDQLIMHLQQQLQLKSQNPQPQASQPQSQEIQSKTNKKLQKYKDHIKQLRRELKLLEKSHHISQKALKHTEQFVDEVVHVNDKLVHSLSKNKTKLLRSMSGGSHRSLPRSQSNKMQGTYDQRYHHMNNDSMNQDIMTVYGGSHRGPQMQGQNISLQQHPQEIVLSNQKMQRPLQNMHDSINQREVLFNQAYQPVHNAPMTVQKQISNYQNIISNQTTTQKPPRSTRNMQRCFSFSKGFYPSNVMMTQKQSHQNLTYDQNQKLQIQRQLQPSQSLSAFHPQHQQLLQKQQCQQQNEQPFQHQQSLETSRFHMEYDEDLNNCSHIMSQQTMTQNNLNHLRSQRSMKTNQQFTLQPYEEMINQVSQKIDVLEKDLTNIQINNTNTTDLMNKQNFNNSNSQSDLFLQMKQDELMNLRREHDNLVKNIRDKSKRLNERSNAL